MNIIIAGYGRMGHEVEAAALARGHNIIAKVDADGSDSFRWNEVSDADVAIEFTIPDAAPRVIASILKAGIPVVSGTTGWLSQYDEMAALAINHNTAFIHSSNYSPGVYILSRINRELAECMNKIAGYSVSIEEIHHIAKLDAPSGTAVMLASQILGICPAYKGWAPQQNAAEPGTIPVLSVREGQVPGTHHINWKSENDIISLSHKAFSRKGFALGALLAAEFIAGKKGVYDLKEVFGF